jgi:hypothetical protein
VGQKPFKINSVRTSITQGFWPASLWPIFRRIVAIYLVEIFKHRWGTLSGGKPIVATAHLFEAVSLAGLLEIWNAYVYWRKYTEPTLPEEERLFATTMNSQKVWVIEDGAAFTLMYPEDY